MQCECGFFSWFQVLSVGDGFRMTYYDGSCKLSKSMISVDDAGNYKCSATNVNGTVSTTCKLEVRSKYRSPTTGYASLYIWQKG